MSWLSAVPGEREGLRFDHSRTPDSHMRILLVEDDALTAMVLEVTLRDAGHEVLGPAASVRAALDLVAHQRPQLALVDIDLGAGGSGLDLARELKDPWKVPVLFVSGLILEAKAHADLGVGCMRKPYAPAAVLDSIAFLERLWAGEPPGAKPGGLELFIPPATLEE
jgi:DNA-binding response OmpR family regulator